MITSLRGLLIEKTPPFIIIETNGLGYELTAPITTFQHLPDIQQPVFLHTHLVIREDAHTLYGFHHLSERVLFRALIKINGVGPKLALSILSSIELSQFMQCIDEQDISMMTRIPGVGKKTAERLLIEMRDLRKTVEFPTVPSLLQTSQQQTIKDAISALITLGYKPNDARRAVESVSDAEATSEMLIRLSLKNLAKGNI